MSRHAGTLTVGVLSAAVYLAGGLGFSASATTVTRTANKVSHVRTASKRRIPRPDQSLLKPQPPADCAFKGPLSNPMTVEETRMKLDYEQQCYRHPEMIVRARLEQLQKAVEAGTNPASRQTIAETTKPTSRQSIAETTKPTNRQSVEEATNPISRRRLKGKRHRFAGRSGSGNHRTTGRTVVWTASYLGYPVLGRPYYRYTYWGRGYAYWRPRAYAYYAYRYRYWW